MAPREFTSMPPNVSRPPQAGPGDGQIQFRLRIGVTGHRDLLDPDAVTKKVHERLVKLRDQFRAANGTRVSFRIYSSLAEGADRLVVREAFRVFPSGEIELLAVLPVSENHDGRDFTSETSVEEFDVLLDEAVAIKQMAPVEDRDEAYARAGRYVADRSDLLFAIWDGRSPWHRGDTTEIVEYARACSSSWRWHLPPSLRSWGPD